MKNYLFFVFLAAFLLLGAGCQTNQDLSVINEASNFDNISISNNEPMESVGGNENKADEVLVDSKKDNTDETVGQVKVKFINKLTSKAVPGHSIYCSGCLDFNDRESNINGEIVLKLKSSDSISIGRRRIDWNNYDLIKDIKLGNDVVVKMTPQIINKGDKIFFPETTYIKNSGNKTQLHITYKDSAGLPKVKSAINITGPIEGAGRKTAFGITDADGKVVIDLPINGSYRISISQRTGDAVTTNFYQFEAPTGYNIILDLDLSKTGEMISGTESLIKSYKERGMILVCVRDQETQEPLYSSVVIPFTNISFTRTVKYNNDICVEVPKSYDKVGVPASGNHNGHPDVSTSGVDANGVLYLYVERVK